MNYAAIPLRHIAASCTLLLAALTGGCASTTSSHAKESAVAIEASSLRSLSTFRGDGTPATFDEVVAAAAAADVVIMGESHGHPVGLPWAALLFDELTTAAPKAALSMEFFERDQQSRLDDYLLGVTDEPTFLKRAERSPGNYPAAHRAMIERAKSMNRPVVAANTPRTIIRYLRGKDYSALANLTAEQSRLFCIPSSAPEGRYRADYDALMGPMIETGHGAPAATTPAAPAMTAEQKQAKLDASFRSQHLWDWTMAESVIRAVDAGHRPVMHVIGGFHSGFFGGTPQAMVKLRPGTKIVTISAVTSTSAVMKEEDRGRADFVVYVGPSPEAD